MTLKHLILLILFAAAGYWAYTTYVAPNVEAPRLDPYAKAEGLYNAMQYATAIDAYRAALKEMPSDPRAPDAQFMIARCLEQDKKLAEAKQAYTDFAAAHPDHEKAPVAKGRAEKLGLQNVN